MVLDQKTNFFLGKRWFWTKTQLFLGKSWFSVLFPRKKMVLGQKTNFFLGKTKKNIFLEFGHKVSQQMVFLFFFGFS